MPLFQCPVCRGTYRDPLRDGARYFHVCPPLTVAELLALPLGQQQLLLPELAGVITAALIGDVLARRVVRRPNARDENIRPGTAPRAIRAGEDVDDDQAPRVQPDPPRQQVGL